MHKSKLYHEKLSEESPKTMAKTAKKKKARENEANDLCIPFCHATSSYYINPSVALLIEAITGQPGIFAMPLRAAIWWIRSDLPSESIQWHVKRLSKVRLRRVSIETQFARNRMCPVNCEAEIGFWRIVSSTLHARLSHFCWRDDNLKNRQIGQGWMTISSFPLKSSTKPQNSVEIPGFCVRFDLLHFKSLSRITPQNEFVCSIKSPVYDFIL